MNELVNQAIKGDVGAFSSLVTSYEQQLYKISRTRLSNEADICDAVQNTLLYAFKSIRKLKKADFFKTWLIRILINECNAIYRQKKYGSIEELENIVFLDSGQSFEATVDNQLDFESAMQVLRFEERQTITLFYTLDLSIKDISKATGMNINTVKTHLNRARGKLRHYLAREEYAV